MSRNDRKLNFTVGPVMMNEEVLRIGGQDNPYFRTADFSALMKENERMILTLAGANEQDRAVFLTASGTGGMEMALINAFTSQDKVLVVNGGSFGARFEELLGMHGIPHETIRLEPGHALKPEHLAPFENTGLTGFVVNMHETSTGVLYDMPLISDFCARNGLFLVVDAISAFLADELCFAKWGIDVLITASQKAVALPPGMSFLLLSRKAIERAERINCPCMYFNIPDYLKNGERGQTPFTPAVGVLLQLHERLTQISRDGIGSEQKRIAHLAAYFRARLEGLPFELLSESPSNAVTALRVTDGRSAHGIFTRMEREYGIWICPNGGDLKETVFRVGHIGALTEEDYDRLIAALREICG